MSLLSVLFAPSPRAGTPAPDADFWYEPTSGYTDAGTKVTEASALTHAAVYACTKVLAESIGSLPLHVYRRLADGGRERADDHPLAELMTYQPNSWQTAQDYWEMVVAHVVLWGNHFSEIIAGPRGFADSLEPIHPSRLEVTRLGSGRLNYRIRLDSGLSRDLDQDQVFHVRGPSLDGLVGMSVLQAARNVIGAALAVQSYGARVFSQMGMPAGAVELDGIMEPAQREEFRRDWRRKFAGLGSAHEIALLENGMKFQKIGMSNEDSQFLETAKWGTAQICALFRVPAHMAMLLDRATFSNIEHQSLEFLRDGLRPLMRRICLAVRRDLILAVQVFYVEFVVEDLLKADTKSRFEAYRIAVGRPWMSPNEVRERENMNRLDDPDMDKAAVPLNLMLEGEPPPKKAEVAVVPASATADRLREITAQAAARLVRREIAAARREAKRYANDSAGWEDWTRRWYEEHAAVVAETLALTSEEAAAYCEEQGAELREHGLAAAADWESSAVERLLELALAERAIVSG